MCAVLSLEGVLWTEQAQLVASCWVSAQLKWLNCLLAVPSVLRPVVWGSGAGCSRVYLAFLILPEELFL